MTVSSIPCTHRCALTSARPRSGPTPLQWVRARWERTSSGCTRSCGKPRRVGLTLPRLTAPTSPTVSSCVQAQGICARTRCMLAQGGANGAAFPVETRWRIEAVGSQASERVRYGARTGLRTPRRSPRVHTSCSAACMFNFVRVAEMPA